MHYEQEYIVLVVDGRVRNEDLATQDQEHVVQVQDHARPC